jgi:hypothetical protein
VSEPTPEEYLRVLRDNIAALGSGPLDRFDAWLAERDNEMAAQALDEAAEDEETGWALRTWLHSRAAALRGPEPCQYTLPHTRHWCGNDTCRDA